MEISPIPGIRAMHVIKVRPADTDLSAIFDIENPSKPGDDTYSGNGKKSAGGQDDDSDDAQSEEDAETNPGTPTPERAQTSQIDYFA
jgi:hypothetical protein